jgi:hypothetical protein
MSSKEKAIAVITLVEPADIDAPITLNLTVNTPGHDDSGWFIENCQLAATVHAMIRAGGFVDDAGNMETDEPASDAEHKAGENDADL